MVNAPLLQQYSRAEAAVFCKTHEPLGGLSNMALGFPLRVDGLVIPAVEQLYQACRFPHRPDLQQLLLDQASPMAAKMKSKRYRAETRPDWEEVKVGVMRWCLRLKLAQHWDYVSELLGSTGSKPIVEESHHDRFWGAVAVDAERLEGCNVLGQLLTELREQLCSEQVEELRVVDPPPIKDVLLLDKPIRRVAINEAPRARPPVDCPSPRGTDNGNKELPRPQNEIIMSSERQPTADRPRLIEVAFPLKQASLDSVHEKNVRHGHISTLHIWPARRPLAACRAALIATLLPDPGT